MKILGVCGGNGVILHPFRHHLVANIEPRSIFTTPGQAQWKLNFHVPFDRNIDVRYAKDVDVIVGAPDCGHSSVFSYSRAKKLADPGENKSLQFFLDQVVYYEPKLFMMENLPKLMEVTGANIEKLLSNYILKCFITSVSAFGNSQLTRIRLVMVGIRKDVKGVESRIKVPKPAEFIKSEKELLAGLSILDSSLCQVREPDDYMVQMYYDGTKKISVGKARKLWNTEYSDLKKWPVNNGKMINQPGVYRNFADDAPLTVRKQNRQFNHKGYMLSPREMARIQGIPDSFKLWYNENQHLYCINKARATVAKTPPYEIGLWFARTLNDLPYGW
jgi:site-specific DNA-cytosine methylase